VRNDRGEGSVLIDFETGEESCEEAISAVAAKEECILIGQVEGGCMCSIDDVILARNFTPAAAPISGRLTAF
jgi:hypothetical protein